MKSISIVSLMILIMFFSSMLALLSAPMLMPDTYSWTVHTTSESAAQGVSGAWVARTGFVLYGIAVLILTFLIREKWSKITTFALIVFGICMIGNALFSSRSWDSELPYDAVQDTLHSWMSGLVGTAFTITVLLTFSQRSHVDYLSRLFDVFAILVSITISLAMLWNLGLEGLLQRFMFFVSYLWYSKEALQLMYLRGSE